MTRPLTLCATLLGAALLLGSCGSTTPATPNPAATSPSPANPSAGGAAGGGPGGQPIDRAVSASVVRGVSLYAGSITGAAGGQGELRVAGLSDRNATLSVVQAPAGLSVTPGAAVALSSGEMSLPFRYVGTASSGDVLRLKVSAGSGGAAVSGMVEVPVQRFSGVTVPSDRPDGYQAASLRFAPGGEVLLSSTLSGSVSDRTTLLRHDPAAGTFERLPFGITRAGEAITSQTLTPDGTLWVTVRGMTSQGGYLVSRTPAGQTHVTWADAAGDSLTNLNHAADGTLWMTQSTRDAVKSLTPATDPAQSGTLHTYGVPEQTDSLVVAPNGRVYFSSFYARPAILELDPATGTTRTFNVGEAGHSLPVALTPAPNGHLLFIEARAGAVWDLDPVSEQQTPWPLPTDARPSEVAVAPSGQVWVLDATNARLYTTATTSTGHVNVVGLSTPASPSALQVAPDGGVWYVAGGQLVRQVP